VTIMILIAINIVTLAAALLYGAIDLYLLPALIRFIVGRSAPIT